MTSTAKSLLDEALNLSDKERAEIAGALLESLDLPFDSEVEEAWRLEVEKRVAQLDAGEVTAVPWSMVRDELYSRLSGNSD